MVRGGRLTSHEHHVDGFLACQKNPKGALDDGTMFIFLVFVHKGNSQNDSLVNALLLNFWMVGWYSMGVTPGPI